MSTIKEMPEDTKAQQDAKAKLLARAKAVGLGADNTAKEVAEAEK